MSEAATAPRWLRRPDERPEEILAAALDVFGEQGYARAKLEDIAKRAGVSKGTIYLYFESKDELFRALVRSRVTDALAQAADRLARNPGPWRPELETLIRDMWQIISSERMCLLGRLIQSELAHFPDIGRFYFDEVIAPSRQLITTVLERGIAAGEFRPEAVRIAPRAIPAMLTNLALTRRFFAQHDVTLPDEATALRDLLDLLLHGLTAPARLTDSTGS
jgi:AcrR family transcriptional regulator